MKLIANNVVHYRVSELLESPGVISEHTFRSLIAKARHHKLRVVVVLFSHCKADNCRLLVGAQNLSALHALFGLIGDGVIELYWSFQGGYPEALRRETIPTNVNLVAHTGVVLQAPTGRSFQTNTGKTEHLLCFLSFLIEKQYSQSRTFVVTLDDDYVVFDPINVLALFAPWVSDFGQKSSVENTPPIGYTKGGGPRIVPPEQLVRAIGRGESPVLTFGQLCSHLIRQATGVDSAVKLESLIATPEALPDLLGAASESLHDALRLLSRSGGRNSRALSIYLSSLGNDPFANALSRFSFLLHGDQGTTIERWSRMRLGRGYALELSFLVNALFFDSECDIAIANVFTIPHSHVPKDYEASFKLGIEVFSTLHMLRRLVAANGQQPLLVPRKETVQYYGLNTYYRVDNRVSSFESSEDLLLPPLVQLTVIPTT